jgi:hypothetical protein
MTAPVIRQFVGTIPDKGQAQTAFDTNVDAFLDWQALQFAPDLVAFGTFASNTAAALVAANLPSLTGRALDAVRVNAAANGVEFANVTAAGWALLDDANAAAQRVTLGAAPLLDPVFIGTSPRITLLESGGASTHNRVVFMADNGEYSFQTRNNDGDFVSKDYFVEQNASGATEHTFAVANTRKLTLNGTGLSIVDALSVGGAATAEMVRLTNTLDASLDSTAHAFQIGPTDGANLRMDGNEIMAVNDGVGARLNVNVDGGEVYIGHAGGPQTLRLSGQVNLNGADFVASGTAPLYACRAWVNFNGTGTVAIGASGNVSSVTDNGTGDYTINFATAISDNNYVAVTGGMNTIINAVGTKCGFANLAGNCRVFSGYLDATYFTKLDISNFSVAIFR